MGGVSVHQQLTKNFADDYGGFAQVTGRGFLVETQRGEVRQPRLCGPIGEQNRYAQIMLMLAPLGLFCLGPETSRFRRCAAVTATAVIVAGGAISPGCLDLLGPRSAHGPRAAVPETPCLPSSGG